MMKKYMRFALMIFVLCFSFFISNNALAENKISSGVYLEGTTKKETHLKNGLTRFETISCNRYDYKGDNPYQYAVVKVDVVYKDSEGSLIASGCLESTFRYNTSLRLAKCLSTSHMAFCKSNKYSIDVFGRTKNLALNIGESFGKITLSKSGVVERDKCKYIFSCDECGNILNCSL